MILRLDLETHKTLAEVRQFLEAPPPEAYAHVERTLRRFSYWTAHKPERGLLRAYLQRTTGWSRRCRKRGWRSRAKARTTSPCATRRAGAAGG